MPLFLSVISAELEEESPTTQEREEPEAMSEQFNVLVSPKCVQPHALHYPVAPDGYVPNSIIRNWGQIQKLDIKDSQTAPNIPQRHKHRHLGKRNFISDGETCRMSESRVEKLSIDKRVTKDHSKKTLLQTIAQSQWLVKKPQLVELVPVLNCLRLTLDTTDELIYGNCEEALGRVIKAFDIPSETKQVLIQHLLKDMQKENPQWKHQKAQNILLLLQQKDKSGSVDENLSQHEQDEKQLAGDAAARMNNIEHEKTLLDHPRDDVTRQGLNQLNKHLTEDLQLQQNLLAVSPESTSAEGNTGLSKGFTSQDGAKFTSRDVATVTSQDGAKFTSRDGATVTSQDGAKFTSRSGGILGDNQGKRKVKGDLQQQQKLQAASPKSTSVEGNTKLSKGFASQDGAVLDDNQGKRNVKVVKERLNQLNEHLTEDRQQQQKLLAASPESTSAEGNTKLSKGFTSQDGAVLDDHQGKRKGKDINEASLLKTPIQTQSDASTDTVSHTSHLKYNSQNRMNHKTFSKIPPKKKAGNTSKKDSNLMDLYKKIKSKHMTNYPTLLNTLSLEHLPPVRPDQADLPCLNSIKNYGGNNWRAYLNRLIYLRNSGNVPAPPKPALNLLYCSFPSVQPCQLSPGQRVLETVWIGKTQFPSRYSYIMALPKDLNVCTMDRTGESQYGRLRMGWRAELKSDPSVRWFELNGLNR